MMNMNNDSEPHLELRKAKYTQQKFVLPYHKFEESYLSSRSIQMQNLIEAKRKVNSQLDDIPSDLLNTPMDQLEESLLSLSTYFKTNEHNNTEVESESSDIQMDTEKIKEKFSMTHLSEICPKLHSLITIYKDNDTILRYVLSIFIKITEDLDANDKFFLFTSNESHILNYIDLLKKFKPKSIESYALLSFLSYLIREAKEIQMLIVKIGILNHIIDTFSIESNDKDEIEVKIYFFSLFTNSKIYDEYPNIAMRLEKVYRDTTFFLSSSDITDNSKNESLSIINNCLWGLSNISSSSNAEFLNQLLSNSIIEYYIDLKIQRHQFVVPTIRLIGNLLGTSDISIIKKMIGFGCVDYITNNLLLNSQCIKEEALWALYNIIIDPYLIDYVFNKKLDLLLLDLLEDKGTDNGSIKEIVSALGGLVENMELSQLNKLDNIRLCKVLVNRMQYCKEENLMYFMLYLVCVIFTKDKEKIFIAPFNNYGGGDLIGRIAGMFIIEQFQVLCNKILMLLDSECE